GGILAGREAVRFSETDTRKTAQTNRAAKASSTRTGVSFAIKIEVLHHTTPRTLPELESELNQCRVGRGNRIGVTVRGPRHGQDLLTVHDQEHARTDDRADLGRFREVLCNRDLRQSESNPNSPASGSRQVLLESSKDGLIGGQHDDVLPRGPNEGPCPSDDVPEAFHDVRAIDRGSARRCP